jgi:dolichol-phosphate mannosyltransferase
MIHILLPAYNEEQALGRVLEGISKNLTALDYRVVVVDDGSQDGTSAVAKQWGTKISVTLVRHEKNQGLGKAFQTGLTSIVPGMADSDILVTLDADDTHPTDLIPRLVQPLLQGDADLAIASRFAAGGKTFGVPLFRKFTSFGARCLFSTFLPIPGVRDYTCGFRAFRGDLLRKGTTRWGALVTENGFASALEWLVKLSVLNPRIIEVPLILHYDYKPTASKMPVWKTIIQELKLVARIRRLKRA